VGASTTRFQTVGGEGGPGSHTGLRQIPHCEISESQKTTHNLKSGRGRYIQYVGVEAKIAAFSGSGVHNPIREGKVLLPQ